MMKHIWITLTLSLLGIFNLQAQQVCSAEDIPYEIRPKYRAQVEQFLNIYYSGLLFNVGDDVIKETYIDKHMMADTQRYKPEFLLEIQDHQQFLQPSQYLQELEKAYSLLQVDNLTLEVNNISINNNFYKKGMASCYLIADYDLTLKNEDKLIFNRRCQAYCLFPNAMAYITVKLMQVEPVMDVSISQNNLPDDKFKMLNSKITTNDNTIDNIMAMEDETLKAVFHVLSEKTKKKLSLSNGIEVLSVFDGKLKEAGVKKGFIITRANNKDVTGLKMFEQIINEAKNSSEKVLFLIGIYPTGNRANFAVDVSE